MTTCRGVLENGVSSTVSILQRRIPADPSPSSKKAKLEEKHGPEQNNGGLNDGQPTTSSASDDLASTQNQDPGDRKEKTVGRIVGKLLFEDMTVREKDANDIAQRLATSETKQASKLKFRGCKIEKEFWKALISMLIGIKFHSLDVSGHKDLPTGDLVDIIHRTEPEEICFSGCEIDEALEVLIKIKYKISKLKLNRVRFSNRGMIMKLADVILNGIEEICLMECGLTAQQINCLEGALTQQKLPLKRLDISYNDLGEDGLEAVARLINHSKGLEVLAVSDCKIENCGLSAFSSGVTTRIRDLELSYNKLISVDGAWYLAKIADKCHVESLNLSGCGWGKEELESLCNGLMMNHCKLQELNLSENYGICPTSLGKLAAKSQLETLDLSECRKSPKELHQLKHALGDYKLNVLDLSDPTEKLSDAMVEGLISLAGCVNKVIRIRCKAISAADDTKEKLKNHKVIKVTEDSDGDQ